MAAVGRYVANSIGDAQFNAFIPHPLPPQPSLKLTAEDNKLLERAILALGRLDGIRLVLPDPSLFIYFYVRKEALLSSQIEGTQASLTQLLLFEIEDSSIVGDDTREVSNYVHAMYHGLKRLTNDDFPLSLRLLRELHRILLTSTRGGDKAPGEFRRVQNWIGGSSPRLARYVPPPPDKMLECLDSFEKIFHDQTVQLPVLIKVALMHYQFESIHPFLDGNGRLGRLLITLMLCAEGFLHEPLLYISLFFKTNRQEYYNRLHKVRTDGDWLGWIRFFCQGVETTAQQSVDTIQQILNQFEKDREKINSFGPRIGTLLRLHNHLQHHPIISIDRASRELGLSFPTVQSAVQKFEKIGVLVELTGKQRNRLYFYEPYMQILEEGTEPLPL